MKYLNVQSVNQICDEHYMHSLLSFVALMRLNAEVGWVKFLACVNCIIVFLFFES